MRSHPLESNSIAKTILVNSFVHYRHAIRLRQQNCERLLPVGHETGIHIGLQGDSRWRSLVAYKANAFIIDLKSQLHFGESVEEGEQCILLGTAQVDISPRQIGCHRQRYGFVAVTEQRMAGSVQPIYS